MFRSLTSIMTTHSAILTTINLLNGPLNMVGQGLPTILAAYASLKRIQTFLEMDEKREIATDQSEHIDDVVHTPNQLDEKSKNDETMSIEQASFSWLPDSPVVLHGISVALLPGKLHMCVGPVASVRYFSFPFTFTSLTLPSSISSIGQDITISLYTRRNHIIQRINDLSNSPNSIRQPRCKLILTSFNRTKD